MRRRKIEKVNRLSIFRKANVASDFDRIKKICEVPLSPLDEKRCDGKFIDFLDHFSLNLLQLTVIQRNHPLINKVFWQLDFG